MTLLPSFVSQPASPSPAKSRTCISCLRCAACRSCPILVSVERPWAHQRPLSCLYFHSFFQGQEKFPICWGKRFFCRKGVVFCSYSREQQSKGVFKWFVLDSLSLSLCYLQCSGTVGRCQQPPITTMRNCFSQAWPGLCEAALLFLPQGSPQLLCRACELQTRDVTLFHFSTRCSCSTREQPSSKLFQCVKSGRCFIRWNVWFDCFHSRLGEGPFCYLPVCSHLLAGLDHFSVLDFECVW